MEEWCLAVPGVSVALRGFITASSAAGDSIQTPKRTTTTHLFLPFPLETYPYTQHTYIYIYAANLGLAEAEMASVAERALNIQPPKIKLKARRLRGHEDSTNCCIASSQNPRIIVTSGEVTSIFKFSSLLFTFHLLYSIIIIITVVVS